MPDAVPATARGGATARRAVWKPHAFELVAIVAVVATVVTLRAFGLAQSWETFAYTLPPIVGGLLGPFAIGLALHAAWVAARRGDLRAFARTVASVSWIGLWMRLFVAAVLVSYAYLWLKVAIPLVNPRIWDPTLSRLDTQLHLGVSPTVLVVELFAGTPVLRALDVWYAAWIHVTLVGTGFFAAHADGAVRRAFGLSLALAWCCGAWAYVSMPALGPCYVEPQTWNAVREEIPRADGTQRALFRSYQRVRAARTEGLAHLNVTHGVAAMPSLHVALHWLFALWAWRAARPLLVPWIIATLLTFLGSLATGWHWAVDGYAGVALASAAFAVAVLSQRLRGPTGSGMLAHDGGADG